MAGGKALQGWALLLFSFHFAQAAALEQGHADPGKFMTWITHYDPTKQSMCVCA